MPLINIAEALEKLRHDEVVALPTETVYGLGGNIQSESALQKIFKTKSRPYYDPLIIHVKSSEQAQKFAHWDSVSLKLADSFWPGPLTLVLPKKENVSDLITNGGSTVAFRQPNHPIFLEILTTLDTPIAAPSANLFGQTSPTTAEHVLEEFNNTVPVVDGGACQNGIESTVMEVDTKKKQIKILRPGIIGKKELSHFLKQEQLAWTIESVKQENSPGFLKNHYQPSSAFFLVYESKNSGLFHYDFFKNLNPNFSGFNSSDSKPQEWKLPDNPVLAARELYNSLRTFSRLKQASYLVVKKEWQEIELWQSLIDRLHKACHGYVTFTKDLWTLEKKQ